MPRFTILTYGTPDRIAHWDVVNAELQKIDAVLRVHPYKTEDELIAEAQHVDGLLEGGVRITRRVIMALPDRVRVIGTQGIGYDSIDAEAATERGIIVFNLPGVFEREVAAHAMMLLLALARHLVPINNAMKGLHPRPSLGPIQHLYGQTLGFVSFGNIPRAMARIAAGFEFQMLAYDPYVTQDVAGQYGVTMVDKETLFRESDFVSCHAPLTSRTHHFLGEQDFRRMKPSAYFINTGRGKVVDEAALIRALQKGWIAGAGLDVLEQEPPAPDNPLLKMDNVVLTSHMASASDRGGVERRKKLAHQLVTILSGRWPDDGLVDPAVRPLAAQKWGMLAE